MRNSVLFSTTLCLTGCLFTGTPMNDVEDRESVVDIEASEAEPEVVGGTAPAVAHESAGTELRFPWNGLSVSKTVRLRWETGVEADTYEVEVEQDCDTHAFRECPFASVDHAAVVRAGEWAPPTLEPGRYFWRVRSCASQCGEWSEVRYFLAGQPAEDFDGDGLADIVVGSANHDNHAGNEGSVFLYLTRRGLAPVRLDNPDDEAGGKFGWSVALVGDVNGDGFADLAVGARGQEQNRGNVFVYYGGADAPTTPDLRLRFDGAATDTDIAFGWSIAAAGDVDADGYADLVVGAPHLDGGATDSGRVFVYHGGPAGLQTEPVELRGPQDQENAMFGEVMSGGGDIDGDGFVDLLVGAPRTDVVADDSGAVYLFSGHGDGLSSDRIVVLDNPSHTPAGGRFGASLGVDGDFDGDGFADIVVGAAEQSGGGEVYIWYGGATPGAPELVVTEPMAVDNSKFGATVAWFGDLDGDGRTELAVGAPRADGQHTDDGLVHLYSGRASRPNTLSFPERVVGNPAGGEGGWLGSALAGAGDIDGDGRADLLVGAHRQSNNQVGAAFVWYGTELDRWGAPDVVLAHPDPQSYAHFGFSVD